MVFCVKTRNVFLEERLAKTYLLCDGEEIVGYYCLLNDKLSKQEVANSEWRKIKKRFSHSKHFGSYPAIDPAIALERFVSQSPKELLIAPDWGLKNYEFTARVNRRLAERDSWQGKCRTSR